jgi:hypothetical protein
MCYDTEKMETHCVARLCGADIAAQALGLGETPCLEMPDRHGKLFGNCGWSLVSAR